MEKKEFIPKELPLDIELNAENYQLLISASRELGKLNGFINTIPNQNILINSLVLQEAKDSSAVENIITTHDELFLAQMDENSITQSAKEVIGYEAALKKGFDLMKKDNLILNKHILAIQKRMQNNNAGFRTQSGTVLKNPATGEVKHIPPQNLYDIQRLMSNLEKYINEDLDDFDPLIRLVIIHHLLFPNARYIPNHSKYCILFFLISLNTSKIIGGFEIFSPVPVQVPKKYYFNMISFKLVYQVFKLISLLTIFSMRLS